MILQSDIPKKYEIISYHCQPLRERISHGKSHCGIINAFLLLQSSDHIPLFPFYNL